MDDDLPPPVALTRQRSRSCSPPRSRGKEEEPEHARHGYYSDDGGAASKLDDSSDEDSDHEGSGDVSSGNDAAIAAAIGETYDGKPAEQAAGSKKQKKKKKKRKSDRITVFCRFRPENRTEMEQGTECVEFNADAKHVTLTSGDGSNHEFAFNRVFQPVMDQADVYAFAGRPLVNVVLNGYNAALICYGQTGSGKTYTMMGPPDRERSTKKVPRLKLTGPQRGVVPRLVEELFDHLESMEGPGVKVEVRCKYIEIYMERMRDLLMPAKTNLKLRYNAGLKHTRVAGATEVPVASVDAVMDVLEGGTKNRATAATRANADSSRSHAILILSVAITNYDEGFSQESELYLVDLAGSEKVSKTGATGLTLSEASMINTSLLALGNVISSLTAARGRPVHVNYRDSALTLLLQNSFGGNSKTSLCVNVSPSSYNAAESLSTLRFADRANRIKNRATKNVQMSVAQLKKMIEYANAELYEQQAATTDLQRVIAHMALVAEQMLNTLHPVQVKKLALAHPIVKAMSLRVFERFPPMLLRILFHYLDGVTLGRVRRVCTLWSHMGKQEFLWKLLCEAQGTTGLTKEMPTYYDLFTKDLKVKADAKAAVAKAAFEKERNAAQFGLRVLPNR